MEKIQLALDLETEAITRLNEAVAAATAGGDDGSRDLFSEILSGEESHADWLEAQLNLVNQVGETNYLSQQIRD